MEDDSVSELDEECDVTIAKETELMKMERSRKQAERRQSMLVRQYANNILTYECVLVESTLVTVVTEVFYAQRPLPM